MKTITFDLAFKLLNEASAVIWGEGFLSYPGLNDEEGENPDEDVFLRLSATDEEGLVYEYNFVKGQNLNPKVNYGKLVLVEDTGEEVELTLLVPYIIDLFV